MYDIPNSVQIVCQSLKEFTLPLDLNLSNLKEIHIDVANGWSCASLIDFNEDLKTKAPQLLKMKLLHFEDWDIYSLPITLESLHLSSNDNSLDLYDLNLEELKNINDFSFEIDGVRFNGKTQAEMITAREKYHSALESDTEDSQNEPVINEVNSQTSCISTTFFKRKFDDTFSSSNENLKEDSTQSPHEK